MGRLDKQKWDRRYAEREYSQRSEPSAWLLRALAFAGIEDGRGRSALDVACGSGRNAVYLAALGYSVDAVDISPVGLAHAAALAREREVAVTWIEADLDVAFEPARDYDLILVIRYVNAALLERLKQRLAPGGYLVCEEYLRTDSGDGGPRRREFRLERGELARSCADLDVLREEEGSFRDPDGRELALARIVARKSEDRVKDI